MKKNIVLLLAVVGLTLGSLSARAVLPASLVPAKTELFRAHELDLDIAASYTAAEPRGIGRLDTNIRGGATGVSGGVSYFPKRNFGLGFETGVVDVDHIADHVLDYTTFTGIARLPIGHFAPSVSFGIGRNFNEGLNYVHLGVGVEWRFNQRLAAFGDGRFIFREQKSNDNVMLRAGLRFAF